MKFVARGQNNNIEKGALWPSKRAGAARGDGRTRTGGRMDARTDGRTDERTRDEITATVGN